MVALGEEMNLVAAVQLGRGDEQPAIVIVKQAAPGEGCSIEHGNAATTHLHTRGLEAPIVTSQGPTRPAAGFEGGGRIHATDRIPAVGFALLLQRVAPGWQLIADPALLGWLRGLLPDATPLLKCVGAADQGFVHDEPPAGLHPVLNPLPPIRGEVPIPG